MIITIAGFKGGVGKTTTAVHLACFFSQLSDKTLLVDGDPNRSSLGWAHRGTMPFQVCDLMNAAMSSQGMDHIIIDTEAHPDSKQLETLAKGCNLLILPTSPDAMAVEALMRTVGSLGALGACGVVLTMVDGRRKTTAQQAREALERKGVTVFQQVIRRLAAYERAALAGVPVYDSGDRFAMEAWGEYQALGKEIVSYGQK